MPSTQFRPAFPGRFKLKQFRRIATRYEKLSRTFMAFIHIASTWIMLR